MIVCHIIRVYSEYDAEYLPPTGIGTVCSRSIPPELAVQVPIMPNMHFSPPMLIIDYSDNGFTCRCLFGLCRPWKMVSRKFPWFHLIPVSDKLWRFKVKSLAAEGRITCTWALTMRMPAFHRMFNRANTNLMVRKDENAGITTFPAANGSFFNHFLGAWCTWFLTILNCGLWFIVLISTRVWSNDDLSIFRRRTRLTSRKA